MADDTKGKAADDGKKVEAPKTLEDAIKVIETLGQSVQKLEGALKETTEESIKRKEKLRAIEQEKEAAENERLKSAGKHEELIKSLEPKAKRADELEKAVTTYYELEIADIPEEKRTLIPDGSVESRLAWIKKAKSQGIFGTPDKKDPPKGADNGKKGDPNAPDFLTWSPKDPRLVSLTADQYAQWKKHNGRDGAGSNVMQAWGKLPA